MAKSDRTLYALNRLTFGPRPGDVARVNAMGLDKWLEQQLSPGSIDDSALDARLAEYPAMRMPVGELQARYPSPLELRQMENGRLALPSDPTARAMVEDQLAFYKIQKAKKEAAAGADGKSAAANPNAMAMAGQKAGKGGQQNNAAAGDGCNGKRPLLGDGQAVNKPLAAAEVSADPSAMAALGAEGTLTRADAQRIAALAPAERMQAILILKPADLVRLRTVLNQKEFAALGDGLTPLQREMLVALPGSGTDGPRLRRWSRGWSGISTPTGSSRR